MEPAKNDVLRQDVLTRARILLSRGGSEARREIVRITLELGKLLAE